MPETLPPHKGKDLFASFQNKIAQREASGSARLSTAQPSNNQELKARSTFVNTAFQKSIITLAQFKESLTISTHFDNTPYEIVGRHDNFETIRMACHAYMSRGHTWLELLARSPDQATNLIVLSDIVAADASTVDLVLNLDTDHILNTIASYQQSVYEPKLVRLRSELAFSETAAERTQVLTQLKACLQQYLKEKPRRYSI